MTIMKSYSTGNEPLWKSVARLGASLLITVAGLAGFLLSMFAELGTMPLLLSSVMVFFGMAMGHSTVFNLIVGPFSRLIRVVRGGTWEERTEKSPSVTLDSTMINRRASDKRKQAK
jgi:hypothetical protein